MSERMAPPERILRMPRLGRTWGPARPGPSVTVIINKRAAQRAALVFVIGKRYSAAGSAAGSAAASALTAASFSRSARMSASRLIGDFAQLVHHGAGAGRDQAADDDVLLQAVERVGLAVDGGLGEHAGRLLERRRRDERARLQRRLGDAEQHRVPVAGFLPSAATRGVGLVELDLVDLLALDQVGVAGIDDLDLLQHLPDDHLDVLVVDARRPGADRPPGSR